MNKYLSLLVLIIFATQTHAFEYRCLKGGMSKDDFHLACNTSKVLSNKGSYSKSDIEKNLHYGFDYSGSPFEAKSNYISLGWTKDGLLWRIQIDYNKPDDLLEGAALKKALQVMFPNTEIQESSTTYSGITSYEYSVVLIDEAVAEDAQLKIFKEIGPTL